MSLHSKQHFLKEFQSFSVCVFCARWDGDVLNVELWAAVAQAMVSHIVFLCVSKKSVIMILILYNFDIL